MTRAFRLAAAAATAAAAGATLFVQVRQRQAPRSSPMRSGFAAGLHYLERGVGDPVVLLHGLGSMLQDFELSGLVERGSLRYRVLAFDRPGYGHSIRPRGTRWTPRAQARLLRSALDELGVERPVIVGHSWGTQVALAYGLEYPGQTRGLVLASGYYYPTLRADAPFLVPPAIPLLGAVLRHTLSPLLGRLLWPVWLKLMFSPLPVPDYFAQFPTWMALRPEPLRAVGEESAMLLPVVIEMQKEYAKLEVPVAIVAGTHDRFVGAHRHSERLHAEIPGSTYVPVLGAGHMVHHAAPQAVMDGLEALMR